MQSEAVRTAVATIIKQNIFSSNFKLSAFYSIPNNRKFLSVKWLESKIVFLRVLAEGGAEASGGALQGVDGLGRRERGCRRGRCESCPV